MTKLNLTMLAGALGLGYLVLRSRSQNDADNWMQSSLREKEASLRENRASYDSSVETALKDSSVFWGKR